MRKLTLLMGLAAAAIAASAGARDTKADHEETGKQDRIICRTEQDTGSRLKVSRRCHTAAEWSQIKREIRQTVDKVQAFKPGQGS